MVDSFPRLEQIFARDRESGQSNIGRSWLAKKRIASENGFGNPLIVGSLRSDALNQPIGRHVDGNI